MNGKRGRPREFNEDEALNRAMLVFWQQGLSATSLDELSDAMNMNRPSIYNAFGSKESLYRASLARFCGQLDRGFEATLGLEIPLVDGLRQFYDAAIVVYCGNEPAAGCLMMCTAPAEALTHPEVKKDLADLIHRTDRALEKRLRKAIDDGELPDNTDTRSMAMLLFGVLQTVALRARAGARSNQLKKLARYAVDSIVGAAQPAN